MPRTIVIVGGFYSTPRHYQGLANHIASHAQADVHIVPIRMNEWSFVIHPAGWRYYLRRLDETFSTAVSKNQSASIEIVAHSLGGIVTRLYCADEEQTGFSANHRSQIKSVVTLGTPHNRGLVRRLTAWTGTNRGLSNWNETIPLYSVAGDVDFSSDCKRPQRFGAALRHRIHGAAKGERGDGVIPVSCAIFNPDLSMIIPGVRHDSHIGRPWFADEAIFEQWWAFYNSSTTTRAERG